MNANHFGSYQNLVYAISNHCVHVYEFINKKQ